MSDDDLEELVAAGVDPATAIVVANNEPPQKSGCFVVLLCLAVCLAVCLAAWVTCVGAVLAG
jgi:hypothetical protein